MDVVVEVAHSSIGYAQCSPDGRRALVAGWMTSCRIACAQYLAAAWTLQTCIRVTGSSDDLVVVSQKGEY